jgi:hypothetical protein
MNSPRARWLAARTRNAARHGLLIAGIGAIVMVAALLTFVLLPRQADRQLTSAIAALPPARDTIMLRTHRRQADALHALADAQRTAARPAMADTDSALGDLTNHIVRARQSPLIESFRSLASAPALQRDTTVRATVNRLRDSLEALHRERDAYAARSGPDARYADMTARLTAQGGVLVALAERSLRVQPGRCRSRRHRRQIPCSTRRCVPPPIPSRDWMRLSPRRSVSTPSGIARRPPCATACR